tara:strand:- start:123 stop:2021 length:1899 start_codon:yes stop_codon:yes gene_type:complete
MFSESEGDVEETRVVQRYKKIRADKDETFFDEMKACFSDIGERPSYLTKRRLLSQIDAMVVKSDCPNTCGNELVFLLFDRIFDFRSDAYEVLSRAYAITPDSIFKRRDRSGKTALVRAITTGCSEEIMRLTFEKLSPTARVASDSSGMNAFHHASKKRNVSFLNFLQENYSQTEKIECLLHKSKGGKTPLLEAILYKDNIQVDKFNRIRRLVEITPSHGVWEMHDKMGLLPIERLNSIGQAYFTVEMVGALMLKLTHPSQFSRGTKSMFERFGDSATNWVADRDFVTLFESVLHTVPELILFEAKKKRGESGEGVDFFEVICRMEEPLLLTIRLAAQQNELVEISNMKRNAFDDTLAHVIFRNFRATTFLPYLRLLNEMGVKIDEVLKTTSLNGNPLHMIHNANTFYDFQLKWGLLVEEVERQGLDATDMFVPLFLEKDAHGKYAFEYVRHKNVLYAYFPYLEVCIKERPSMKKQVLEVATRIHCYGCFNSLIEPRFLVDDNLLQLAAKETAIISNIMPRRLIDHLILEIHPSKIKKQTMQSLMAVVVALSGRERKHDVDFLNRLLDLKRRWKIFQNWKVLSNYVSAKWIGFYWLETAVQKHFEPGGEEMELSISELGLVKSDGVDPAQLRS